MFDKKATRRNVKLGEGLDAVVFEVYSPSTTADAVVAVPHRTSAVSSL
jgi:hypothetical protein